VCEELRKLREYIQRRESQIDPQPDMLDMEGLLHGLELIRSGLSDEESSEIERAMNEEYVEPLDHNE
jgi:hypothetical protein